jgi:hypothetical protein
MMNPASLAVVADHRLVDLSALRHHAHECARARGSLHRLRCAVEALDGFLAPRFVTALGVLTLFVIAGMALLV